MSNLDPVTLSDSDEDNQDLHDELTQKEHELLQIKQSLKRKLQSFNIDNYLNNVNLIQKHSNLPSLDFTKRLETVKLFYPDMIISDESSVVHHDEDHDEELKITYLEFKLSFKVLLKFHIKIKINGFQVIEKLDIEPIHLTSVLEASDILALIKHCKITKDISLFIHSINVFYKLQQTRLKTFINLFDLFIDRVTEINEITNTTQHKNENKYMKYIKFSNKSDFKINFNNKEKMIVQWKLDLNSNNEKNKWRFQNNISCYLFNDQNELIENLTDISAGLIKTNGTFRSLAILLENILAQVRN